MTTIDWTQTVETCEDPPRPVPGEEDPTRYGVCEVCVEKAVKSADEWRARAEARRAVIEKMRPVVEAAVIYCTTGQDRGGEKLLAAIKSYVAWEQRND